MKKKFTADELYKLFSKSAQVKWDGLWLQVYGSNEDEVYLIDDDGEEYHYTYEEMAKLFAETNSSVEFYELKKIDLNGEF